MRLVVAVLVLLVFAPAARADVTFTGVPASPTNTVTFDVGFSAGPNAVRFDCVHVFPDGNSTPMPGCTSPFEFRDVVDGRHELQVTAFDVDGAQIAQGAVAIVIDTVAPPAPAIVSPSEGAQLNQTSVTISGTTEAPAVKVFDGATELGDAVVQGNTWSFDATSLAQGPHTVTAVARDAAGNTATSADRHFSVDTGPPAKPTIDVPVADFVNSGLITLGGSTEPGTTVTVSEGNTEFQPVTAMGGTWAFTPPELSEGAHTFTAVAKDAAGNTSPASDPRVITVDTTKPAITFGAVPASPTNHFTFDVEFSANEPVVFDCVHVFPDKTTSEVLGCDSPFELRELQDGTHELQVTASDRAGNEQSDSVSVTIDTQAPEPVEATQTGASEFTFTGEAGATFECSVDGAAFAACSSPQRLTGLDVGEHRFAVLALDAAGNRSTATTKTFTVAPPLVTPAATAEPTPASTPPAVVAAAPSVELGRTLVARTVSGKVFVRRPATTALLDLGTVAGIPVGTEIDARGGRVRLIAAATGGKAAHRAEFFGGVFVVTQGADDVVDLKLSQPFGSCAKKTGTRLRKVWGDGRGRFRMSGLYATVTVRGTRWLVQDSCEGTLTRVSQGVVSVRDTVKRKTVLVRAGRKYLAVPKKRK
ncbi:Ig-like domain-containing protein [Solirubrobacter soli]|uniref:Ig-like domain-containing protein n=1 Tax=Solirubrobacter soli TaxID=363832 RepID=UPI0003F5216F|nr:Ig-like domain-containing protein [Solirubrobacter soli]